MATVVETCLHTLSAGPAAMTAIQQEDAGWLLREALASALRSKDLQLVSHLLERLDEARNSADEDDDPFGV